MGSEMCIRDRSSLSNANIAEAQFAETSTVASSLGASAVDLGVEAEEAIQEQWVDETEANEQEAAEEPQNRKTANDGRGDDEGGEEAGDEGATAEVNYWKQRTEALSKEIGRLQSEIKSMRDVPQKDNIHRKFEQLSGSLSPSAALRATNEEACSQPDDQLSRTPCDAEAELTLDVLSQAPPRPGHRYNLPARPMSASVRSQTAITRPQSAIARPQSANARPSSSYLRQLSAGPRPLSATVRPPFKVWPIASTEDSPLSHPPSALPSPSYKKRIKELAKTYGFEIKSQTRPNSHSAPSRRASSVTNRKMGPNARKHSLPAELVPVAWSGAQTDPPLMPQVLGPGNVTSSSPAGSASSNGQRPRSIQRAW